MTKDEAHTLIARIQQDAPPVRIALDTSKVNAVGHGYRLHLHCCQRQMTVTYPGDWPSIQQAWRWLYLPEEQITVPPRPQEQVRHVVDGVPMVIKRRKDGVWYAANTRNGKTRWHYFGKVDPRPNYPVWKEGE